MLLYVHINNFISGKTTNERFARKASNSMASSFSDESDSLLASHAKESILGSSRSNSIVEVDQENNGKKICFIY